MNSKTFFFLPLAFLLGYSTLAQVKNHAVHTQSKLSRSERSDLRKTLSREDGAYFLAMGGIRRHKTSPGNNIYVDLGGEIEGSLAGLYGYRWGNASLETGLGFLWHNSSSSQKLGDQGPSLTIFSNYNSLYLPMGIRYGVPFNSRKSIRFGAHASGNIILHTTNKPDPLGRFPYTKDQESNEVAVQFQVENSDFPIFFKVGLYAEFTVFKSSYLLLQGSHLASSSSLRTISYQWQFENQSGSFQNQVKLDGWMLELAYKLPLSILKLQHAE